jgi:hypothetical protein
MTIFSDYKVWLSVILGVVAGWSCLWLSEQLLKLLKKISLKKQLTWRIIDLLLRITGMLMQFIIIFILPISILPRGVNYPLYYYVCYFIAFVIGALIRLPKLIKWMKVNQGKQGNSLVLL